MSGDRLDGARLPCGQPVAGLLSHVADGRPIPDPEHHRACPHCRAAVAELGALWEPVRALAAEDVRAPADLLSRTMRRVRELVSEGWYAVIQIGDGRTRIAGRVVGAVARLAAEEVPGIALALGRGRTSSDTATRSVGAEGAGAAVGVAGSHVVVDVDVIIQMGASIASIAQVVRERIVRRVGTQTGLTTTEVNVRVVDVADLS